MSDVLPEIISEILTPLPVKSLMNSDVYRNHSNPLSTSQNSSKLTSADKHRNPTQIRRLFSRLTTFFRFTSVQSITEYEPNNQ
ncbi:hypothetical protein P3L10_001126 [Capsicum annuum]